MKQQLNLQDNILNAVRKKKIGVTIFLMNGYQLNGMVAGFDNFTIILKNDKKTQMVYKHAISTIIPQEEIEDIFKVE
ncbi:RNA chaperone Hfq [Iocasia frigidifontis]|uniref:RNA-binding protein Hfq n=1 Tax=Iocasia fonsfrigidae TaxID=2682810 RepID=A0A8A7KF34_9FIRM|nr:MULTISPECIES: RNA chaperone Hfq [Halanaerobiaceae]AZO95417.1 RNA chaperone Hfq [Halocella sp. SP3-1]QTL98298.1 RNA chaperone Hfq [Iocasia fonsfrigidae]